MGVGKIESVVRRLLGETSFVVAAIETFDEILLDIANQDWRLRRTGLKQVTIDDGSGGYARLSCPGPGTQSEQFGDVATASGKQSAVFGHGALANAEFGTAMGVFASALAGTGATALGQGAAALAANATAVGRLASAGSGATGVGNSCVATGTNSVALGVLASATATNNIAIGQNSVANTSGGTVVGSAASALGASSVAFGGFASAAGTNSVALGFNAATLGESAVAIGLGATANQNGTAVGLSADAAGSNNSSAYGRQAVASGQESVAVGALTTASASAAIAIGMQANAGHVSIALGKQATTTANNQFVVGSVNTPVNDVYIGEGVTSATPQALSLNATGGSGTDIASGAFQIAGGRSTGNATAGILELQTGTPGVSGTAAQTLATRLTISDTDATLTVPLAGPSVTKISNAAAIVATDTADAGERMIYDPTAGTFQISAPASPVMGTRWATKNRSADLTSITISGNGLNIENPTASFSLAATFLLSGDGISVEWEYDGTQWLVV